jgi:hypothetical protein
MRAVLPSIRESYKDPGFLRHLETVGNEFAEYYKGQSPEGYAAFVKRVT